MTCPQMRKPCCKPYGCLLSADVAVAGAPALPCLHTPEFQESTHAHCARYLDVCAWGIKGWVMVASWARPRMPRHRARCPGAHVRVGSLDHRPGSRLGMLHGGMAPAVLPRPPCGEQRQGLKPLLRLRRSHRSRASAAGYEAVEHAGDCHPLLLPAPPPTPPPPR